MRLSAALAFALIALPAAAQQAPLDKIYACASESDGAKRLACFDAAVASLKQAQGAGGVVVVERSQIEKAEKEAFGLPTPTLSELARSASAPSTAPVAATSAATAVAAPKPPAMPGPLDRVLLAVKAVEKRPDGSYRFVMENGQVWVQTDSLRLAGIGKGPWTAEIKKAALGSFLLKLDNRTAVRAKRLE